nr:hypothetical protein StreXyl84_68710 [Streptomyces sp. Xyl84]
MDPAERPTEREVRAAAAPGVLDGTLTAAAGPPAPAGGPRGTSRKESGMRASQHHGPVRRRLLLPHAGPWREFAPDGRRR